MKFLNKLVANTSKSPIFAAFYAFQSSDVETIRRVYYLQSVNTNDILKGGLLNAEKQIYKKGSEKDGNSFGFLFAHGCKFSIMLYCVST